MKKRKKHINYILKIGKINLLTLFLIFYLLSALAATPNDDIINVTLQTDPVTGFNSSSANIILNATPFVNGENSTITSINLTVWNSAGTIVANISNGTSPVKSVTNNTRFNFSVTLTDGLDYIWNVIVYNNASPPMSKYTESNRTFSIDTVNPSVTTSSFSAVRSSEGIYDLYWSHAL